MDRSVTPIHYPPQRAADDAFTRISGRITRWALGWGLLSLHATIFTITMIAMVLWNIYDAPNDIWVDDVFRRWGVVLAFHAIAVAAGLTAWRLIKAEQQSLLPEPAQWTIPARAVAHPVSSIDPASSMQPAQAPRALAATAGWAPVLQEPVMPATPPRSRRYLAAMQRADAAFGRALASSASWTGRFGRQAVLAISSGTSALWSRRQNAGTTIAPVPINTWPESPGRHRPEDEEFISRFGGNSAPASGHAASANGVDIVLDVSGVSPEDSRWPGATPIKGPGQSWVQAATYNWHVPHEPQPGITPAAQNGHAAAPPHTQSTPETTPPPAAND